MKYTFQRVAAYCGLRLSYYSTAGLLALIFIILVVTEYKTASPLYILLCLAILPSILKAMFFSSSSSKKEEKRENDMAFPLFCEKYQYTSASYKSMNLAYLLLFILLAAWHISYSNTENIPRLITSLPVILATVSLAIRILGVLGYRLYFQIFPIKAMH